MSESLEDCVDEETLIASTHGWLDADAMEQVEGHLDRCDACRELVAEMMRTSSQSPSAPADQLEVGASCDRYLILNRIGVGGMGVVYSAWDDRLDRKLALKVVRPGGDPRAQQRLLREARVMASIRHPNVLTVYEVGEVVAGVYIAMEYLRGGTLRDWLVEHPDAGWRAVLARFTEAGRGLDAAHGVGVVHRDFKPDNVLLEGSRVCVADFGLARAEGPVEHEATQPGGTGPAGTPAYMAPETTIGPAVDQYALCVATWEALFGELPQGGCSRLPVRSGVPAEVRRVLERGLEGDPARRFASVAELISALERAASPRRWSVLGLAVVGVIGTGLGWTQMTDSCGDARHSWNEGWSRQRRDRLRAAFSSTNAPYAAATFDQLEQRIDRYIEGWTEAATDACRHPDRPHVVETRRCLDSLQGQAIGLLEAAQTPRPDQLETLLRLAIELPSPEQCESPDWVYETETLASMSDEVAEVELLMGLRSPELAAALEALEDRVDALGNPGLRARLAFVQGMEAKTRMDTAAAVDRFREAVRFATIADRPHELFNATSLLAMTEAQRGRFEWSEHWQDQTQALALRMGERSLFAANAHGQRGFVHRLRGQDERAKEELERALELFALEGVDDVSIRVFYQQELATVSSALGEHEAAFELLEHVVATQRELYGEHSPLTAAALGALAVAKSNAGELDAALVLWDESLRISAAARGKDDIQVVAAEAERATLLLRIDPERALAPLQSALDAFGGMESRQPVTMIVRDAIARAHARLGDGEEAVRRWNAILEDMGALEASEVGLEVHLQLGLELAEQGAVSDARRHLERAAEIGSANPDLSRPWEADLAVATAVVSLREGEPTPGPVERALADYEERHSGGSERALATFVLARSLLAQGRHSRARLVLEDAVVLSEVHDRVLGRRISSWRSEHFSADHQDSGGP